MERERSRSTSVADGAAKSGCSILPLARSRRRLPDFDVRACITSRLRGGLHEAPRAGERANEVRESGSERAPRVRAKIHFVQERDAVRPSSCSVGRYEGAVKKRAPPLRGRKKRTWARRERERGGGYVTRRKKGARAKREAVNLGLLLGNRNSF